MKELEEEYSDCSFEAAEERLPSAMSAIKHNEDQDDSKKSKWAFETMGHFDFGACGDEALQDCGILWKVPKYKPLHDLLSNPIFPFIYIAVTFSNISTH